MENNQLQKKSTNKWQVRKLNSMFVVRRGGSPRPIENYITTREDGLNWLKIGDIDIGAKYITSTSSKIMKEGLARTTLVKKGDFILSNSMSFGRPYIMNIEACIHDGWLTFQNIKTDVLNRDFLYYLLSQSRTQAIFASISAGSGVQNLKKETVSEVELSIPPLSEQDRIVFVLETWDKAIEKLKKLIEVKKRIKSGLMQDLLTGKKRVGVFRKEWKNGILNDIFDFKKGSNLAKEKLNESGKFECILYGELYTTYNEVIYSVKSKTDSIEGLPSKAGDILIPASTTTGALDLAVASCVNEEGVLLGGDINVLRSKVSIDSRFFAYYLTHVKKHNLARLAQGVTIVHLYYSDFKNIRVQIPEKEEQEKIANIITTAEKEISELEMKLSIFKDQKKFLLNNLIIGTIRTPENLTMYNHD